MITYAERMRNGLFICAVFGFATLGCQSAFAHDVNVVLNGKSYHLDSSYDWNENNAGLGIEVEFAEHGRWKTIVMANGFRDSAEGMTYMAGAGIHRNIFITDKLNGFYVSAGINAFLMTREDVNNNEPFPGVLPSLSIGTDTVGVNLSYLPRKAVERTTNSSMVDPTIDGIVFLQFKIRLDKLLP